MPTFLSHGSATTVIGDAQLRALVRDALKTLGSRTRVLAVPPDATRAHSRAGVVLGAVHDVYGAALVDVLPALGTHRPMTDAEIARMYPDVARARFRDHDWRNDVVTVGTLDASFVSAATEGVWDKPWPAQLNKLIAHGGHDLILSIGQVVPHEVAGMANHNKNLFIGAGGAAGINESHFIGAAYGMERMMGRADTPVRRLLDAARTHFCKHLPFVYVLTVVGPDEQGRSVTRGVFVGDDEDCFVAASALSLQCNFTMLDEAPKKCVVFLDPHEFQTTWLGNKAVYRTRLAIADGGELVILAPGVHGFGEDPEIDRLIRAYGYRGTPTTMAQVRDHADLRANLSAAAHLIHGASEGRFAITWAAGGLKAAEVEGVGYRHGDVAALSARYRPDGRTTGWHRTDDGERFFFVANPALGLWAWRGRLPG
ncbi:MAG TPA: lactate racemase domain-containing protein [Planctomycetota bacterium]|nr:lactate racemase domain-containing protein [Planctomycetota bacterium]